MNANNENGNRPGVFATDESERIVLAGALLAGNDAPITEGPYRVYAYNFRSHYAQSVVRAILTLKAEGKPVELLSVVNWLEEKKTGVPASYVSALLDGAYESKDYGYHRERITQAHKYRTLAKQSENLNAAINRGDSPESIERLIDEITVLPTEDPKAVTVPGVLASTVTPERVTWLWKNHVPIGKVTIFDGDPGLGKSTVTLDIAARVTHALHMPDGSVTEATPRGVVIVSLEDGIADTIVPRLKALGAELSKVRIIQTIPGSDGVDRTPTIPDDLPEIEAAIHDVNAALLVIDPLVATMAGDTNTYRDQDIRRAMAPVAALAEKTGISVIAIRHLNKSANPNPKYRGGGSIGIIGAARASFIFAENPDEEGTFILAANKLNLCAKPPALKYRLVETDNGLAVTWEGETTHTAESLVAQPDTAEESNALSDAKRFLKEALASGPVNSKDVMAEAKQAGISDRTLYRAKDILGVQSKKTGAEEGRVWKWELPESNIAKVTDTPPTMAILATLATLPKTIKTKPFNSTVSPNIANIAKYEE